MSQRSGFHSAASSPHSCLLTLIAWKWPMMTVSAGTTSVLIIVPSRPRTGAESGSRRSFVALRDWFSYEPPRFTPHILCAREQGSGNLDERVWTYTRPVVPTGAYTRKVSRQTASRYGKFMRPS